jgi:sulfate/thiosulfate transport system permease protein
MVRTPPTLRFFLRLLVVGYLVLLVAWPVSLVVTHTFADGFTALSDAFADANVVHALQNTLIVASTSVLINLVFGVTVSILLVRFEFPGKRLLSALIDVPLSVSPVVVGLALLLVYNPRDGWFGPTLADAGVSIIFSTPGMILATTFVALPLVIREVVPVLEEIGDDQEWAARSLGAGPFQTLRRITLPGIKWAIVYGVVLSLARSLGEFGAVKVVAGNVGGETTTAPVLVQQKYQNFQQETAYSVSFMLAFAAVLCLIVVALLRPKAGNK